MKNRKRKTIKTKNTSVMMRKSEVWITVVIYTLVVILALSLLLGTGLPILNEMKDRSVFSKTKELMLKLDSHLTELAGQGEGSQSLISFELRDGKVLFDDGRFIWEITAKSPIVTPRTTSTMGNMIVSSNANVRSYETESSFILETDVKDLPFSVNISRVGSPQDWQPINTSKLIRYIDFNGNKMDGSFNFNINGNEASTSGTGYTMLVPGGNSSDIGRAKVIAHVNSTFAQYDLEIIMESYSDFLTVKMRNFEPK